MNYTSLPEDIIRHIIEFDGKIKYRKYMNQIHKNDERYSMLNNILESVFLEKYNILVTHFSDCRFCIIKVINTSKIFYKFSCRSSGKTMITDIK